MTLLEDTRTIYALQLENGYYEADGVNTRIEVYAEVGNGAMVPWFKVFEVGEFTQRINATSVQSVRYERT